MLSLFPACTFCPMFDNKFCIPIQEKENGKKKINLNWSLPLKLVPQVWKPSTEKIMNVFLPKKKNYIFWFLVNDSNNYYKKFTKTCYTSIVYTYILFFLYLNFIFYNTISIFILLFNSLNLITYIKDLFRKSNKYRFNRNKILEYEIYDISVEDDFLNLITIFEDLQ